MIFGSGRRRRRRKHSSSKNSNPQAVAQDPYAIQPPCQVQDSNISHALPRDFDAYAYTGHSIMPPEHPIYGAMPQELWQESYVSSHLQPVQPYVDNSAVHVASSPPRNGREGGFKASWHRVDRMATKSYGDLREQVAAGAERGINMLTTNCIDKPHALLSKKSTQFVNQGAALCDLMSNKLDAVITSIDGERFSGKEQDLLIYDAPQPHPSQPSMSTSQRQTSQGPAENAVYPSSSGERGSNHFSKVWLYSNSRLPPHQPPFKVYIPTFPLLCLAASYSESVYTPPAPRSSEAETHIPSDWRSGTKAMVLKTIPIDEANTLVFAIRGSQTFMDWAVNYRSSPTSPAGFLDDEGNLCHAGFLHVARKMIQPVADRLRTLLEENPSRSHCSLLITGHSAGGAVASLLYAHMMSTTVTSDLNYLTGFFKRVHCITFGAPPISLLPLERPNDRRHRKSLFFSFINEGDPVPQADKQVVRSLLKLYASPAPNSSCSATLASLTKLNNAPSNPSNTTFQSASSKYSKPLKSLKPSSNSLTTMSTTPKWEIPPCTLSTAGRLVVLRPKVGTRAEEDIEAVTVDEEVLRGLVYGDPLKHMMSLYKSRIEQLAVRAVTARGR
ncbi:alpha/beta-hydrolase [Pleomassaria siparia CBS 279.74]|uniref:Alpha/beta-hydrolase n=1 Tax=Pleomassaria siparia CBS 279.74 TaxID=1314801 RepID=A0A6G1KP87_9PLEO|nr:alpha/beta-hydrolase [Pleomassaria siparia CBS 279.74]